MIDVFFEHLLFFFTFFYFFFVAIITSNANVKFSIENVEFFQFEKKKEFIIEIKQIKELCNQCSTFILIEAYILN
jgi:hypothetical protein